MQNTIIHVANNKTPLAIIAPPIMWCFCMDLVYQKTRLLAGVRFPLLAGEGDLRSKRGEVCYTNVSAIPFWLARPVRPIR
jgi:hypothetical protein